MRFLWSAEFGGLTQYRTALTNELSPQEDYQDSLGTATHNVGEESDTAAFIQSGADKGNR